MKYGTLSKTNQNSHVETTNEGDFNTVELQAHFTSPKTSIPARQKEQTQKLTGKDFDTFGKKSLPSSLQHPY